MLTPVGKCSSSKSLKVELINEDIQYRKKIVSSKVVWLGVTLDQCTREYLKANQKVVAIFLQVFSLQLAELKQERSVCNQNAVEINGFFSNFLTN